MRHKLVLTSFFLALLPILSISIGAISTRAGTIIVVNDTSDVIDDDGQCTLREAIIAANTDTASGSRPGDCIAGSGNDTIDLTGIGGRIDLTEALPSLSSNIILKGPGRDNLTVQRSTGGAYRILTVDKDATVTVSDLAIGNGLSDEGGGIYNAGTLVLEYSTVLNNIAQYGGGIYNAGTLTLENSIVHYNTAEDGGGIYNHAGGTMIMTNTTIKINKAVRGDIFNTGMGGGIYNGGSSVEMTDSSTISGNRAGIGGGIFNGGPGGMVELINSSISGNRAQFGGGGIDNFGMVRLTNCTISANRASDGGGIFNSGTMTLTNCTVSDNEAYSDGGGIDTYDSTLSLESSIVAKNRIEGGAQNSDCVGTIISLGYNLDGDGTCSLNPDLGDLPRKDPMLGLLQLNPPGNTATHALLPDSPAIDAIPLADCIGLAAKAKGSLTPPTASGPIGTAVTNGDFLITRTGVNGIIGNGIDEETTWTFGFTADPTSVPLRSALLILTLTPKNGMIINDVVKIQGLPPVNTPLIQDLPLYTTSSIQLDLLDFYSSGDILRVFTAAPNRQIPMAYGDDSIISYGRLVLNATDQRGVPRPQGVRACDIGAFELRQAPTAITLISFTTQPAADYVTLTWQTGTETDNAGFNLHRATSADGPYTKLNDALIPAEGDPESGASYTYTDTGAVRGVTYYYKLEDVDIHGVSTFHGPVSAMPGRIRRIHLPLVLK